jgi:iron complex transport system substrate-binding protein
MRCLLFLLLLLNWTVQAAIEVTDDRGSLLKLGQPAGRIISLAPHLTELLYAAGSGSRLVGVVRDSDYPPQARSLTLIGDAASADFERIVALQPDLVLAWGSGNRRSIIERLENLGFPVLVLEPRALQDIPRQLRLLGRLAGSPAHADSVARTFEHRLQELRRRYRSGPVVNVMFEMWHRPIMTVNGEHIISDVLRLCGARNVFADLPRLAGEISVEQVLAKNPDAIVVGSEAPGAGMADWQAYPYMNAVRHRRIYSVSADLITRQTPRILDAAESICATLDRVRAGPR